MKYEEEGMDLMVDILDLRMGSLYGQSNRNNLVEKYIIKSESLLVENKGDRVFDYEPLRNCEYVLKKRSEAVFEKVKAVEKKHAFTPWYVPSIS